MSGHKWLQILGSIRRHAGRNFLQKVSPGTPFKNSQFLQTLPTVVRFAAQTKGALQAVYDAVPVGHRILHVIRTHEILRDSKMDEDKLLERITVDPKIFGGKPIVRGRRLAVEHVLGMLAAGDTIETILEGYPWLEREDVLACLVYARRLVGHERVEPPFSETAA